MSRPDRFLRGIATTAAFRVSRDVESEPISQWDEDLDEADDPEDEDDWDEDDWDDEDERDGEDQDGDGLF